MPVVRQNGRRLWRKAGPTAAAYFRDPIREPGLVQTKTGRWCAAPISLPRSLKEFPERLASIGYSQLQESAVFPAWSDAAASGLWLCAGGEFGLLLLSLIGQTGVAPPAGWRVMWWRWTT